MNVLVIHGPNLNLLGEREPSVYGHTTLAALDAMLVERAHALGAELRVFQSNHEGALIDRIHGERGWADGIVINPGALGHYSYALRDALAAVRKPTVEVHLSDVKNREPWRRISVIEDVCLTQISGKGVQSYVEGLEAVVAKLRGLSPA